MEQTRRKNATSVDDRRKSPRTDMAETGIAVLPDGTRVVCIIHDMSETGSRSNFGMRVELIDVPPGKAFHSFDVHMKSGRVIRYTPGWKNAL